KVRIDDGKTVARHRFDSLSNWSSCTFTKDGNYCVVVQATPWKTIDPSPPSRPSWIFFNMNTGEVVHRKNFIREPGIRRASIQDVVFDCNEEHIIAGCEKRWDTSGSGRTYYFKKETGDSSDMVTLGADGPAGTSVQFSSTCNYMATSLWWKYDTPDDGLSVYNTATKERLVHLKMATSGIRREFTPDEKYLVVAKDGILLYELSTGKLVFANDWATITTLAVAPNKNVVATHFSTSGALFMQQLPTSTTDVTHSDIHSDILYPNPSTGAVEIKCTLPRAGVLTMTVSTSDGRVVRTMMQPATDGENRFAIPTADLSSGGYLLRCTMGGGYSQTYSFIITK
ncbi:MAG: T9SS type A sorting domain-containing protein, partial [Candidatus Kapabacteria bacterium]|nr:T9SS type A sorting domain-containing protein [Candidatus Kapabacteria bacterium]